MAYPQHIILLCSFINQEFGSLAYRSDTARSEEHLHEINNDASTVQSTLRALVDKFGGEEGAELKRAYREARPRFTRAWDARKAFFYKSKKAA